MQHLGGNDDRLLCLDTLTRNLTLDGRYAFKRHLDAEVATSYHDAIACLNDFVDIVNPPDSLSWK